MSGVGSGSIKLPPYDATTRNSVSLFPLPKSNPFNKGVVMGVNRLTTSPFRLSPWDYYGHEISSYSMLIFGEKGKRKSTFTKALVLRHFIMGIPAYIIDPKGEYGDLAKTLGISVIDPSQGSVCPLAKIPGWGAKAMEDHRTKYITTLVEIYLHRPLSITEQHVVRGLAKELDQIELPILDDVIQRAQTEQFPLPPEVNRIEAPKAVAQVRDALVLARDQLHDVLNVRPLHDATIPKNGLVVNLAKWYEDPVQLAVVLASVTTWLSSRLHTPGRKLLVLDEAWAIFQNEAFVRWLQAHLKFSRQWALSTVLVVHKPSDLTAQSSSGSVANSISQGIIAEFAIIVSFYLPKNAVVPLESYGLAPYHLEWISNPQVLPAGSAFVYMGNRFGILDMIVTSYELQLVNTDQALKTPTPTFEML